MQITLSFSRTHHYTHDFNSLAELVDYIRDHRESTPGDQPVPERRTSEDLDDYVTRLTDAVDWSVMDKMIDDGADIEDESHEVTDWTVDDDAGE